MKRHLKLHFGTDSIFEVIAILSHDASDKRRPVNSGRAIEAINHSNRHARKAVLLIASSTLLLPLTATFVGSAFVGAAVFGSAAQAAPAARSAAKTRVPLAALAALARARRLMTPVMAEADTGNIPTIEISLQHALELAPQWVEARRVFARWKTARHQWLAAATGWQAVLQLMPADREAQSEIASAARRAAETPAPFFSLAAQPLVGFGHDLSGGFNNDLNNGLTADVSLAAPWKYQRRTEMRSSAKFEKLGVQPLPPLPPFNLPPLDLKAVTLAAAPAPKTPEKTADNAPQNAATAANETKANAATANATASPAAVPIVAGVTTIFVPEEDGIPLTSSPLASKATAKAAGNGASIELPGAPENVPLEARVALARGRQLAGLIETLPEAENWALTELQRAIELAPQWAEVHREMALWQEEHGDWNGALQSWEKVAELAPGDEAARAALQKAMVMAQAQNMWGNRSLVSLGHDSSNPIGHGDFLSVRALAAPLPSPRTEPSVEHSAESSIETGSQFAPLSSLLRLPLQDAVKVEVQAKPIAVETAGEDKILLAQGPAAPSATIEAVPAKTPAAPPADTLVPVAPPPTAPDTVSDSTPAIDLGAPVDPPNPGADDQPLTTLTPVPSIPTAPIPMAPSVSGSSVNVKTVLPGAASLPKPVVKPMPKPLSKSAPKKWVKKPLKTAKKPKKSAAKVVSSATVSKKQAAAAWPWINKAGKSMESRNFPAALSYYQKAYALDPKNPYSLYGIPNTLSILKRYSEAIPAFQRFLVSYPGHPKGLRGLADAYTFSGQYQEAADLNGLILAHNAKDFGAALQAAQVLAWSKNYEESGRFYRMALAVQPNSGDVWTEYAETLSYAKDDRAREAFNRALQINPQSQRALLGMANVLSWSGEYGSAVPYYGEALKSDPNNLKARLALADALAFSNRAAMAIPEYEAALKLAPDSPQARLGLGRALTLVKQYPEAIALLSPLVKEQPTNAEALEMLGVAQIANQPGAAVATFEDLLKLQDQAAARANTLATLGDLRGKLNQPDEARAAYEEAIKLAPQDNKVALSYTRTLMLQELYEDAEPVLDGVLQRDPANQAGLILQATMAARLEQNERAAALTEQLQTLPLEVSDDALNLFYALRGSGNAVAANRLLAQLAEGGNATPENLIKVANAVRDTGQEEASYALYQRVLQADADNTQAHLQLAEAYMRRQEFDAAQKEVDAVLARQPGSVPATVMGATLALRREHSDATYENATIVAKNALEKDPNNISARLLLGEVASTRSNFALAVENYSAVLEAQPNNLQARLGLARNLNYLKQVDKSIEEYQLLVHQAPDDATVKLELAQVFLDSNRLEEAQRLFVDVLKAASYPLPESIAQLARLVPGGGDIVSDATQRALREFAAQEKIRQTKKIGG